MLQLIPGFLDRRKTGILNGLIAYYKLDEGGGTRADSSGAGLHLSIVSGSPASGVGQVGGACAFIAASSQFIAAADDNAFTAVRTWAGWFNLASKGANRTILSKGDGAAAASSEVRIRFNSGADRIEVTIGDGTTSVTRQASAYGSVVTGNYEFCVAWLDEAAQTLNIQINNGTVNSSACTITPYNSTQQFRLGRDGNAATAYWDGSLDEWGLWNRVLTAQERAALYHDNRGKTYPLR